jgi:cytochrome c553
MSEGKAMLKHSLTGLLAGLALLCAALPAPAQTPAAADAAKAAPDAAKNEGLPVQSDLVRAKCGSCHRSDDKGRMSRISPAARRPKTGSARSSAW